MKSLKLVLVMLLIVLGISSCIEGEYVPKEDQIVNIIQENIQASSEWDKSSWDLDIYVGGI